MRNNSEISNTTTSICPSCGKVTVENFSMCMYCGIRLPFIACEDAVQESGKTRKSRILDVDENRAHQWGDYASSIVASPLKKKNLNVKAHMSPAHNSLMPPVSPADPVTDKKQPASQAGFSCQKENGNNPKKKTVSVPVEYRPFIEKLGKRFKLIKCIGKGGMATIFLARELSLDRPVAIKLLSQRLLRDRSFVTRFIQEAKTSAALEHPNIVRIHGITAEKDVCFFIMSHIPGGSLADRLKHGPLNIESTVAIALDICSALEYAHLSGVIHRDIKPSNILFDSDGRAVLADFGIARSLSSATLTAEGQVLGTPRYMSPEQALGKRVDAASDMYSFGAVLYEMLTGRPPFKAENAVSFMYKHVHVEPRPPAECNPEIPTWLSDAVLTCLSKQPRDRYNSIGELKSALTRQPLRRQVDAHDTTGKAGKRIVNFIMDAGRWLIGLDPLNAHQPEQIKIR